MDLQNKTTRRVKFFCRAARPTDSQSIANFQIQMARETEEIQLDPGVVQAGVGAVLSDPGKGQYWVVEADGRLVASTLVLREWSDWRNGDIWWIHSVYVLPEFRRQGVFRTIYENLKKQVQSSPDIRGLRLYVEKENSNAQAVYRSLGMVDNRYAMFEWMKDY